MCWHIGRYRNRFGCFPVVASQPKRFIRPVDTCPRSVAQVVGYPLGLSVRQTEQSQERSNDGTRNVESIHCLFMVVLEQLCINFETTCRATTSPTAEAKI